MHVTLKDICDAIAAEEKTSFGDRQPKRLDRARMLASAGFFWPVKQPVAGAASVYDADGVAAVRVLMKAHENGHSRSFIHLLANEINPKDRTTEPRGRQFEPYLTDILAGRDVYLSVRQHYEDWRDPGFVVEFHDNKKSVAKAVTDLNANTANWELVVFPVMALVEPILRRLGFAEAEA